MTLARTAAVDYSPRLQSEVSSGHCMRRHASNRTTTAGATNPPSGIVDPESAVT